MDKAVFFAFTGLLFLIGSCSIIEDSDITDPDDPNQTALNEIQVSQNTQEGLNDIGIGSVTVNGLGKPTNVTWTGTFYDPSEYRFAINQPGTVITNINYDGNGRISEVTNSLGGSDFKTWDFEYDAQGRMSAVVTTIELPDTITLTYLDSIVYSTSTLASTSQIELVKRKVFTDTLETSNLFYYYKYLETLSDIAVWNVGIIPGVPDNIDDPFSNVGDPRQKGKFESNFFGGGGFFWFGSFFDNNPNFVTGNLNYFLEKFGVNLLLKTTLVDSRLDDTGFFFSPGSESRLPNYYYFHPFQVFPDLFEDGINLSMAFLTDWWIVTLENDGSFNFTQNRETYLQFIRGQN